MPSFAADTSERLHRALDDFNKWRLAPCLDRLDRLDRGASSIEADRELRAREVAFVESERAQVRARAAEAPADPDAFVAWYVALEQDGPGQHHPLFDWLERDATVAQMRWFLSQEIAGEAGFDDLVALTQVKMPTRAKLELARNYWDEMGQGNEGGMHGPMLSRLADELRIPRPTAGAVVPEALALGNLLVALAMDRSYAYHSVGALGVIELTAPGRAQKVNAGLKRLGIAGEARRYFALHATLDLKHSEAWNREILRPLVAADARTARPLAEGALMRLNAGARCFERYVSELGLTF